MGFFDGLLERTQNPLFLGGVNLMMGAGPQGMMQGMAMGSDMQERARKRAQEEQRNKAMQGALGGLQLNPQEQQFLAASPEAGTELLQRLLMERNDPMSGLRRKQAELAVRRGEADLGMMPLEMQLKKAQIAQATQRGNSDFQARAAAALSFGLDPNTDAGRTYILTGKMPREDQQALTATDKKAILEADENVGTNRAALQAIEEAQRYNKDANAGWFANERAQIGANLPDALVPDAISSPKSSEATINFDNAVTGQALTQLKAIFGGNPTEGERKILLDLQGSSGKPAVVRSEILARAQRAAEARLKLNEQRSQELRGGSYYKPGGGSAATNPAQFESRSPNVPKQIKSQAEYQSLPPGTRYVAPDGQVRVKQ